MGFQKKEKYKKTTEAALAIMLGMSAVPFVDMNTALAATSNQTQVEAKTVKSTQAIVSNLTAYGTSYAEAYDKIFKMDNENVEKMTANGGIYPGTKLEYMLDNNPNTHWETRKNNNETFTNELVFDFKEKTELDRIGFLARSVNQKGFPTEFEIYKSDSDEGKFELVSTGKATKTREFVEFKFQPTEFKRLKFVFKKADINRPFAAEFRFYKPDALAAKVEKLFTDGTMSQVATGVTLDEVNKMLEQAKAHPNIQIAETVQWAKDILEGTKNVGQVITVEQRGDGPKHARTVLKTSSYGANYLPTGIAALAGEQIKVYVDAEEGKPLPKISFSQQVGSWNGWQRTFSLKRGENVFTVPTIHNAGWAHKVIPGGAIYIVNPYTPEEQGAAPRIRIEGGHDYPLFRDGDHVETFMQELQMYKEKLTAEPEKYVDIVELVNDYTIINSNMVSAQPFLNGSQTPQGTLDFHEQRLKAFFAYAGITEEGEDNHIRKGARANLRLMQPWAFAYAAGDHTGFQQGSANVLVEGKAYGWAIAHEIGHHLDIMGGKHPEVTNNMWSNYNIVDLQDGPDRIEGSYNSIFTRQASDDYANLVGEVNALGIWWQLHLLDENYWAKYQTAIRNGIAGDMNLTQNERMAVISSYALGMDVTEHFERNKYLTDESLEKVKAALQELKIPVAPENIKPWYMWTKATKDRESKFEQAYKPEIVSVKSNNGKVEIKMNMDESAEKALLGYEVVQDGKVLGFTRTNTFTSIVADDGNAHEYKVRAFDLRSNATEYSDTFNADLTVPTISVVEETVVLVNSTDFNINNLVQARSAAGEAISNVTVSGNVDITKVGAYDVTYTATDAAGKSVEKVVTVHVVSDTEYVSDLTPTSVEVGWKTLSKDRGMNGRAIRLLQNGQEKVYEKGIGAHANSKVVYSIAGKNYEQFEAFIGIDGEVRNQAKSSAKFEVWVDGVRKYESDVMKSTTEQAYVKVDVKGAQEIVLITDGVGNTSSDHTVWADAKFATANSVPTIQAEGTLFTSDEVLDLGSLATATDVEDGDLAVTYTTNYQEGKLGQFDVTYTATDRDGNTTNKTIQIFVAGSSTYVSDVNWESATVGWGDGVKKDTNIDNRTISLQVNGERTEFAKGLGAHATSTIVYDLNAMEVKPEYFTSYVGLDASKPTGDVVFKVYADDVLVASTGSQKPTTEAGFLRVNLSGVNQLKLVADANGSNGMDHAVWADAKFHYGVGNVDTSQLVQIIEDVKALDKMNYTQESVDVLQNALTKAEEVLASQNSAQEEVNEAVQALQAAKDNLVEVDLTQVIAIQDEYLKQSIQTTLGITGEITLADMYRLTTLTSESRRATSLAGLEYARNLVTLDISGNQITDFSPLKDLNQLENLITDSQVEMGEIEGPAVALENVVKGINGEKLKPSAVYLTHIATQEQEALDVNTWGENPETFTLDLASKQEGLHWLMLSYEVQGNNVNLLYLVDNKKEMEIDVATNKINEIKVAVQTALTSTGVDVNQIEQISIIQPKVAEFVGNETEQAIVTKVEELLAGKIEGKFSVMLWNNAQSNYTTAEEVLQNNLMIVYQQSDDQPMYMLRNGEISQVENN